MKHKSLNRVPPNEKYRAEHFRRAIVVRTHRRVDLVRIPLSEYELIPSLRFRLLGHTLHLLSCHSHANTGRVDPADASGPNVWCVVSAAISEWLGLKVLRLVSQGLETSGVKPLRRLTEDLGALLVIWTVVSHLFHASNLARVETISAEVGVVAAEALAFARHLARVLVASLLVEETVVHQL